MQSLYIYGSTHENRVEHIDQILSANSVTWTHSDVLDLTPEKDKKSISISQVRDCINFLATAPLTAQHKIVVISKAHLLTPQAQNALLKTAEEPSKYGMLILAGPNEGSILETLLSRCKRVKLTSVSEDDDWGEYTNFVNSKIGDRFLLAEKLIKLDRSELIKTLEQFLQAERSRGDLPSVNNLKALVTAKNDLENTNINGKLVIEWLCVNLE